MIQSAFRTALPLTSGGQSLSLPIVKNRGPESFCPLIHTWGGFMKQILIGLLMATSGLAQATTLECQWLKTSDLASGFYKPAKVKCWWGRAGFVVEDSFTSRRYEPCWVGNFSSCYFGFDYSREEPWQLVAADEDEKSTTLVIENSWYWTAEMTWQFESPLSGLETGETVLATVSGDDGDGVSFDRHKFACIKKWSNL